MANKREHRQNAMFHDKKKTADVNFFSSLQFVLRRKDNPSSTFATSSKPITETLQTGIHLTRTHMLLKIHRRKKSSFNDFLHDSITIIFLMTTNTFWEKEKTNHIMMPPYTSSSI